MEVTLLPRKLVQNNLLGTNKTIYNTEETASIMDYNLTGVYAQSSFANKICILLERDKNGDEYYYIPEEKRVVNLEKEKNRRETQYYLDHGYRQHSYDTRFCIKPFIKLNDEEWALVEKLLESEGPSIKLNSALLPTIELGKLPLKQISQEEGQKHAKGLTVGHIDSYNYLNHIGKVTGDNDYLTFTDEGKEYAGFVLHNPHPDINAPVLNVAYCEMAPIEWVIDKQHHALYSANTLYCPEEDHYDDFYSTYVNIMSYLRSGFIWEAFGTPNIIKLLQEKLEADNPYVIKAEGFDSLKAILSKINTATNYVYDIDKVIVSKVKKKISDYNKNVSERKKDKSPLTLLPDPHHLYTSLLSDLNKVYNQISINNESLKAYKDFSVILMEGEKDKIDKKADSLSEEFFIITKTLKENMPEMMSDFHDFLNEEIKNNDEEARKMYVNIEEGRDKPITLEELKNNFLHKLQVFLVKMQEKSLNNVSDTNTKYLEEVNNMQSKATTQYNSFLREEIKKEAVNYLMNASSSNSEYKDVRGVKDILYSLDKENDTEHLKNAYIKVHKLALYLEKEKKDDLVVDMEEDEIIPLDEDTNEQKKI